MTHRLLVFSSKPYDRNGFGRTLEHGSWPIEVDFAESRLEPTTAKLADGYDAVCAFVNDDLGSATLHALADVGIRTVALRCAGYNNVDLATADELGITVARVPAYSPNAVAEHTIAMMLSLNRQIPRAFQRVRDRNFSLEGLVGFDMAGKTAAVIGTGQIGRIVARLLWHLRCNVIAVDPFEDEHLRNLGVTYGTFDDAIADADIVTLNCPLTEGTHHLINADTIRRMKPGVMLVNTGRGALVKTTDVIDGLKAGQIGSVALDVYEEEEDLFFEDRSQELLLDDTFARLLTFPNVLVTAHQAFLTREALDAIATTTLDNVTTLLAGGVCDNTVGSR